MRGRGNAPETGRRAELGKSWRCSSKPPRNPRPLGRGGGQWDGKPLTLIERILSAAILANLYISLRRKLERKIRH